MNCDKIAEIYKKTCEADVVCYKENFNINYPVAEQLHMRNCLLSMTLLYRHCPNEVKTESKPEKTNNITKRLFP